MSKLTKTLAVLSNKTFSTSAPETAEPIVTVAQGKLKGDKCTLYNGSQYYSFKGVPYAQPPVGKLRFKAPLPAKPWEGVLNAKDHGPICPQVDMVTRSTLEGSEDCLFLNVYTKSLAPSRSPVMFFIHGGAFMSGSGNSLLYGPEFLLQHNVVLVTINYRLEVLGFLCLDTEEVPGNAGMKDQVMALKWVKENITQFGGDPENITIFGESAGGASVSYHMMSQMSRGLFDKAIIQSGVCISDWSQGQDGKERAFRIGKHFGKDFDNTTDLLEFLQSLPATELVNLTARTLSLDEKRRGLPIHFAPVVEKQFPKVQPFLEDDPLKLLISKSYTDVPIMIGYNDSEGLLMMRDVIKKLDFINKHFNFKVPREIANKISEMTQKEFGNRIKKFYFGDKDATDLDSRTIVDLESDINFIYGTHRFLQYFVKNSKNSAFMYKFCLDTNMNFLKNVLGFTDFKGASHADELFYLFDTQMTKDYYEESAEIQKIVHDITKMWTSFAAFGNPTPDKNLNIEWEPFTLKNREYLTIGPSVYMENFADKERVAFWDKLYRDSGLPFIEKSSL